MLIKKLYLIFVLLFSSYSFSGPRVGNGGGGWGCLVDDKLQWVELLDLYEAKHEFKYGPLETEHDGDILASFNTLVGSLLSDFTERVNEDKSFEDKLKFNARFNQILKRLKDISFLNTHGLELNLKIVMDLFSFVDRSLVTVEDAAFRIMPKKDECLNGEIIYLQIANFTNDDRLLVSKKNWSYLSVDNRVALVFHEALYLTFRTIFSDEDSSRARKAVALLFSNLSLNGLKDNMIELFDDKSIHSEDLIDSEILPFILTNAAIKKYINHSLDYYCEDKLPGICSRTIRFKTHLIRPGELTDMGSGEILYPYFIDYKLKDHEIYCSFEIFVRYKRLHEVSYTSVFQLRNSCLNLETID